MSSRILDIYKEHCVEPSQERLEFLAKQRIVHEEVRNSYACTLKNVMFIPTVCT